MLLTSFSEILTIGALLPFLGVLTAPDRVFEHPIAQPLIQTLELTSANQLMLPLTIVFVLVVAIAGVMRLIMLWVSTRLSFESGAEISISIYRRTLYQPYAVHVARNSSEIINGISNKSHGATNIILMIINFLGSVVMMTSILIALMSVDPVISLAAFVGFGVIYIAIVQITRKQLLINSQIIAHESTQVIKSLQEGLGGIRDVLIDGNQSAYCNIYSKADLPSRRAQGSTAFIVGSPRISMEALGMILIAFLAYILSQGPDGLTKAIPILGVLALGAQRLLPVLQQAYACWTGIQGGRISLQDTLDLLDQPLPDYANQPAGEPIPFLHHIGLKNLSFRYSPQTPWVLKNLNFRISKGSRIGIIGLTGSGKSTMLDIVMGLLQPTDGKVVIDNQIISVDNLRGWQLHIAHVPQSIFLTDNTIEENIAFGVAKEDIDRDRVEQASRQAHIHNIIQTWPKKYRTFVGERGIRLSGGQRQRIGIARALYKKADVIVFDEATSALDNETEEVVMKAIEGLSENLTVLIIAHRLTTLKNCTQIVELRDGVIKRVGTYQDIMTQAR